MADNYVSRQDESFRAKLRLLEGKPYSEAYPYSFSTTTSVSGLKERYASILPGTILEDEAKIAGRVMNVREMGKTNFYDLQEDSEKIQLVLTKENQPRETEPLLGANRGDIYGVEGAIMKTRRGELSLKVSNAVMLAKCLRHMPDKWEGLTDPELIYRMRPIALLTDPSMREIFKKRARVFDSLRRQLNLEGFLEVDTPILQPVYGGANARPFVTHHNALDQKMFLRISNELYLKRLIMGGIDRVYEFARDFRNEGIDATHNPEFTQLEVYQSYADYTHMMDLTEKLISGVAMDVTGSTNLDYLDQKINVGSPWTRLTMEDAVQQYSGIKWAEKTDSQLKDLLKMNKIPIKGNTFSRGKVLVSLFEHFVEPNLIQPTMILDYPEEISPLAKKHRSKEGFVERFEFFIGGREFGNAYSELNDPLDQRRRFENQHTEKMSGDEEAHPMDEDFLKMMEYGMPPTGGLGIGIDRLVSLITGQRSIKDVLFFPALRQI